MRILRQWGLFLLGFTLVVVFLGIVGEVTYRTFVPAWRRVEIDWTDLQSKASFLGDAVRDAQYVVLGNSVALRGINTGCFEESIGPGVNLALSSADIASYYSAVDVLQRQGADTRDQIALVVVYQDMFRPWTSQRVESGSRFPTTFQGMLHLLRHDASPPFLALGRWFKNLLDASIYRFFPKPVQVTALRHTLLGQLPTPEKNPELFNTMDSNVCACDAEILPYHNRPWWIENHRCASGSEPSFPTRLPGAGYEYSRLNAPSGIPNEYPYVGLVDVLSFLRDEFRKVCLVVFPDKYGYADLDGFNDAMKVVADRGGVDLISLTDLDVAKLFYDEHHARPEGMELLTQTIVERMGGVAL